LKPPVKKKEQEKKKKHKEKDKERVVRKKKDVRLCEGSIYSWWREKAETILFAKTYLRNFFRWNKTSQQVHKFLSCRRRIPSAHHQRKQRIDIL
jgi:hypothetical protein